MWEVLKSLFKVGGENVYNWAKKKKKKPFLTPVS